MRNSFIVVLEGRESLGVSRPVKSTRRAHLVEAVADDVQEHGDNLVGRVVLEGGGARLLADARRGTVEGSG